MPNTKQPDAYGLVDNPARRRKTTDHVGVNITLPFDLHRRLKIKQIQLDLTLTEAMTAAVQLWVDEP
jgi:hypothetical protein